MRPWARRALLRRAIAAQESTEQRLRGAMFRSVVKHVLLLTVPTLIFCLVAAEIFFRTVAPACETPLMAFDRAHRMLRFDVESRRDGVFTFGNFARHRSRWRVNNEGWNCAVDYETPRARRQPLIALIGDSFVEGLQVDVDRHMDAVLRSLIGPTHDVYAFGISGAPLSQYLLMSRYVAARFDPSVLVFVIVHNDFTESIRELEPKPLLLQVSLKPDTPEEVPPVEYHPNRWRRLLGRSAGVRFFYLNAGVSMRKFRTLARRRTVADELDQAFEHREEIHRVTRHLVGLIRAENPTRRIIFTMVPERFDASGERPDAARAAWLHDLIRDAAAERSCDFVDLNAAFLARYREEGARFDFDEDAHWNATGQETAAREIYAKLLAMGVLDSGRNRGASSEEPAGPGGAIMTSADGHPLRAARP